MARRLEPGFSSCTPASFRSSREAADTNPRVQKQARERERETGNPHFKSQNTALWCGVFTPLSTVSVWSSEWCASTEAANIKTTVYKRSHRATNECVTVFLILMSAFSGVYVCFPPASQTAMSGSESNRKFASPVWWERSTTHTWSSSRSGAAAVFGL